MDWIIKPSSGTNPHSALRGCFGSVIGGAASRISDNATAVHPGFRQGLIAMTCIAGWLQSHKTPETIMSGMDAWADTEFNALGDGGAFVSEPQSNLQDWAERFWTKRKYEQLLDVKKKWDPDSIFLVHHGVGSSPPTPAPPSPPTTPAPPSPSPPPSPPSPPPPPATWTCSVCGHVYNPVKDGGGKAFEDLPDSWVCPVCGAHKSAFKKTMLNGQAVWTHHEQPPQITGNGNADSVRESLAIV